MMKTFRKIVQALLEAALRRREEKRKHEQPVPPNDLDQ